MKYCLEIIPLSKDAAIKCSPKAVVVSVCLKLPNALVVVLPTDAHHLFH